jgi:hypothetical protein
MKGLFWYKSTFNDDISAWDVTNVMDMSYMFSIAGAFHGDISACAVSNATDTGNMFHICFLGNIT